MCEFIISSSDSLSEGMGGASVRGGGGQEVGTGTIQWK